MSAAPPRSSMVRLLAALGAVLSLLPAAASAQGTKPAETPAAKPAEAAPRTDPAAKPPSLAAPGAASQPELDAATRELVRREVERAKEEMRDEMRAEIQGAQSAREFMESSAVGERPKLDFLQLNGYLRVRGDLFDNLDLRRDADASGFFLFPRPLVNPARRGTLTSANMRLRVEPTLNVSEQVRVMAQIDLLDDLLLGQTPQGLFARSDANTLPFGSGTQVPPESGVNSDRSALVVKRAWAEVQTPVGLLSFGRMPSAWGMGILSHAGEGIEDDLGDSVDRLQFALLPLSTPLGKLVLVPTYEIVATGVTSLDPKNNRGLGQPFDRDTFDDARALGIKVVHAETAEEVKRRLDRNETSTSYGAWYQYKTQSYEFPAWAGATSLPSTGQANDARNDGVGAPVKRDAYAHVLDLWARLESRRFRLEVEGAGIIGQIGNASTDAAAPLGPVLLRQFGGAANAGWKFSGGRFVLGAELGIASGDTNPGFGNRPGRPGANGGPALCGPDNVSGGTNCPLDGAQFAPGDRTLDIRNFRFNPAYRVDMVLFREILQGVTDAWYLKPQLRYEVFDGLAVQGAVIYSQALFASSTPSRVSKPLGIEFDLGISYRSDDGFVAFLNYGLLQPLDGLGYETPAGRELTRGHAIRTGLAVKF